MLTTVLAFVPPAAAQSWRLQARTGLRVEDGGDARLEEGTHAARRAFGVNPRLEWQGLWPRWDARVAATPGIELPPRRSGDALSRWRVDARLRRSSGARRIGVRAELGRVAFEAPGRWAHRRRLSARARWDQAVRPDLVLSLSYGYDGSRYAAADPGDAERTDHRHGVRLDALWAAGGRWGTTSVAVRDNASGIAPYDYRAAELAAAGGLSRGRLSVVAQASHEWRDYDTAAGEAWRLIWAGLRTTWRLTSCAWLYAGAQQQRGRADGERLFVPWRLLEAGLRVELPLGPTPTRASDTTPPPRSLAPHSGRTGWVFRFLAEDASSVHLVGSFTGWDPAAHPMHRHNGGWETTVALPPGIHEYAFLVDGRDWRVPPAAPYYVDDGFGRENGVIVVAATAPAAQGGNGP